MMVFCIIGVAVSLYSLSVILVAMMPLAEGNSILIRLRETDTHLPFTTPPWAHHYTEETVPKRELTPKGHNFWWLEIGGTQDTIADADTIRDELLKTAYGVWAYVKNHPDEDQARYDERGTAARAQRDAQFAHVRGRQTR